MDEQVLNILRKYLDNRCTPEELERVRKFLQNNQHEKEWAAALDEDAEKINRTEVPSLLPALKTEQLLERIIESTGMKAAPEKNRWWFLAAASVLILLTAGLVFVLFAPSGDLSRTVTMAGEQTNILLPDGTHARLNDQSKLTYPGDFDGDTRTVYLEGRAFFDVAPNSSQPFVVHTEAFTIRVTGTSFDVSAYKKDQDAMVIVASGSVSVTGPPAIRISDEPAVLQTGEELISTLMPGEQLTYDKLNRTYYQQTITTDDIRALNEGRLIFQNQTLGDISRALERRYGIQFRFEEESVKEQRLTFKPNSSNLDEIIQVLSLAAGLEYEVLKDKIYISER